MTAPLISDITSDWTREALNPGEWNPGKRMLASLRDYQRHATALGAWAQLRKKWAVLRHRFWSAVSGADIPLNYQIGGRGAAAAPQWRSDPT
ncbi:hypothetical protein [Comamonas badia]|uniref:hypothetical protein n=1 Tax=Comamonas badia TaxID=265291 RepID=UPI0012EB22F4|nr:hypothetical protein [Comamonas badia]